MGGAPYITVNSASVAPGAKITFSVLFTNGSKTNFTYSNKIFSGTY
jgi:uncharacterized repeat protein (TIGR01451 family)